MPEGEAQQQPLHLRALSIAAVGRFESPQDSRGRRRQAAVWRKHKRAPGGETLSPLLRKINLKQQFHVEDSPVRRAC